MNNNEIKYFVGDGGNLYKKDIIPSICQNNNKDKIGWWRHIRNGYWCYCGIGVIMASHATLKEISKVEAFALMV